MKVLTERSYINQLQILMKYFVNPLKEQDVLSNDEFTILFGQIEMIYNLNTELLKSLEGDLSKVGKAFLRLAPFFKLYSVYAFDYNRSQIVLQVNHSGINRQCVCSNQSISDQFLGANREEPKIS